MLVRVFDVYDWTVLALSNCGHGQGISDWDPPECPAAQTEQGALRHAVFQK